MSFRVARSNAAGSHPRPDLDSPFLNENLFAPESREERESRLEALERQSPFQHAFQPGQNRGVEVQPEEPEVSDRGTAPISQPQGEQGVEPAEAEEAAGEAYSEGEAEVAAVGAEKGEVEAGAAGGEGADRMEPEGGEEEREGDSKVEREEAEGAGGRDLEVSATQLKAYDSDFEGKRGTRFKELVEWAAKEVGINPGLLAANLLAEAPRRYYLTKGKVSTFVIGTDDFYDKRHDIRRKVAAYSKIRWDQKQAAEININEQGREVRTISFDSGRDAVLASAVYLKHGEVVLREMAAEAGKDFDTVPTDTRFALVRLAFNAGHGRAREVLRQALEGREILVRKRQARAGLQRNATIRAAQGIHLSDKIFGVPIKAATEPQLERAGEWFDEGQIERDRPEPAGISKGSHNKVEPLAGDVGAANAEDLLTEEWLDIEAPEADEAFTAEKEALIEAEPQPEEEDIGEAPPVHEPAAEKNRNAQRKIEYLTFVEHRMEQAGRLVALAPGSLDPGFYDADGKYKIGKPLQECLTAAIRSDRRFEKMQVALVDLTKHLDPNRKESEKPQPDFAGYDHQLQVSVGSIAKVAATYAAYQLQCDLRFLASSAGVTTEEELFSRARSGWIDAQNRSAGTALVAFSDRIKLQGRLVHWESGKRTAKVRIRPAKFEIDYTASGGRSRVLETYSDRWKIPNLERIFRVDFSGKSPKVEFRDSGKSHADLQRIDQGLHRGNRGARAELEALEFMDRMRLMIGFSTNLAAASCIRDVGYLYIASTMLQSGLYDPRRGGGLWLGSDYGGYWADRKKTKKIWFGWRGGLDGGSPQAGTAASLAAFMTLVIQGRLVSKAASDAMRSLMNKDDSPGSGSRSPFEDGLEIEKANWPKTPEEWNKGPLRSRAVTAISKLGLLDKEYDCAYLERTAEDRDGNRAILRYVAVGLGGNDRERMRDLILKLDQCIQKNNALNP